MNVADTSASLQVGELVGPRFVAGGEVGEDGHVGTGDALGDGDVVEGEADPVDVGLQGVEVEPVHLGGVAVEHSTGVVLTDGGIFDEGLHLVQQPRER